MAAIGWVDLSMLGVLLLSIGVGVWRGLVFELLSLMGWVVAYLCAQLFSKQMAVWLPLGQPGSALNHVAAYALTFFAALVVWALLARLVRMAVRATPLSALDRMLGAGFGAVRAGVLLLVTVTLVGWTPLAKSAAWQASQGVHWLRSVLDGLPSPAEPAQRDAQLQHSSCRNCSS